MKKKGSSRADPAIICRSIASETGMARKLYVFIDETGTLGTGQGQFYIICACLVSDPDGFEEPIRKINSPGEVHARTNRSKVPGIVRGPLPSIERIYHVALIKPDSYSPPGPIRHMVHTKMLQIVADRILSDIPYDLDVTVDSTGIIPGSLVQGIFKKNPNRGNREVDVTIKSSAALKSLQAHDAITWLHGQMYNDDFDQAYLIMDHISTAIVTRAEWLGRIHDGFTDVLVSEDDELHMLRWEYNYYFPKRCYERGESPNNILKGYPKDWNDFIDWAYEELQSNRHNWPDRLPDLETFRKEHPIPYRYNKLNNRSMEFKKENANHVHTDVYKSHSPHTKSAPKYKNLSGAGKNIAKAKERHGSDDSFGDDATASKGESARGYRKITNPTEHRRNSKGRFVSSGLARFDSIRRIGMRSRR